MTSAWVQATIPFRRADDHSCTDMSGILLASCMAGTTILLLSWRKNQTGFDGHSCSVNTLVLLCVTESRCGMVVTHPVVSQYKEDVAQQD